jgi:Trypsin-like peptidase domain
MRAFIVFLVAYLAHDAMAATIPTEVKKVVTFVFLADANRNPLPIGTGFFLGVKNEINPDRSNVYLVTAKHVLKDKNGIFHAAVWLRLNKRDSEAELVRLDLTPDRVFTHPSDPTVDIAVIAALPNERFDFRWLPEEFLVTKESFNQLQIAEGTEVFFTGLFTAHYGQKRNYPIVRFGRVALISEERITWKEADKPVEQLELYLIETLSFGGNSGSPVFFSLGADRIPGYRTIGRPVLKLAGIMKGSFNQGTPVSFVQNTPAVPLSSQNMGIAAVVPSYLLRDILFSEPAKKHRAAGMQPLQAEPVP